MNLRWRSSFPTPLPLGAFPLFPWASSAILDSLHFARFPQSKFYHVTPIPLLIIPSMFRYNFFEFPFFFKWWWNGSSSKLKGLPPKAITLATKDPNLIASAINDIAKQKKIKFIEILEKPKWWTAHRSLGEACSRTRESLHNIEHAIWTLISIIQIWFCFSILAHSFAFFLS